MFRTALLTTLLAVAFVPPDHAAGGSTALMATLTGGYLHTSSSAAGTASITISPNRVCWKFSFHGVRKPGVSGIHVAPPAPHGEHTRSVFPFTAGTTETRQCESPTKWGSAGPSWLA